MQNIEVIYIEEYDHLFCKSWYLILQIIWSSINNIALVLQTAEMTHSAIALNFKNRMEFAIHKCAKHAKTLNT